MRNFFRCLISGLFLFAIVAALNQAQAQIPVNDNYANATVIATLPFSTTEPNMGNATLEAGVDLDPPCHQPNENSMDHTIWYKYTTAGAVEYVTLTIPNNHVSPGLISVYTGTPGTFSIVSGGCSSQNLSSFTRIAGLRLAPNTTYSIQVGSHFGSTLNFSVTNAVQYQVTKTVDTADGACDADCSLREAISASNANPGAVIIPAGTYTLTIPGALEHNNATGDLDQTQAWASMALA